MKSIGSLRLFLMMATLYMFANVNPGWAATAVTLETKLTQYNETFKHNFSEDIAAGPYSLESGTLPPGVVMNLNSVIGYPTEVGVYTFTITGFDLNGDDDRVTYTVRVLPWDPIVAHDAVVSGTSLDFVTFYFWDHVTVGDVFANKIVIKSISDSRATFEEVSYGRVSYVHIPEGIRGDLFVEYSVIDIHGVESNTATITFHMTGYPEMELSVQDYYKPEFGFYSRVDFRAKYGIGHHTLSYTGEIPEGLKWEEIRNGSGSTYYETDPEFWLSGIPTKKGVYPLTVTFTDSIGQTKSISYTIDLGAVDPVTASHATFDQPYGGSMDVDLSTLTSGDVATFEKSSIDTSYFRSDLNGSVLSMHSLIDGSNPPRSFTIPYMVFGTDGNSASGTITVNLIVASPTVSDLHISADHSGSIDIDFGSVVTRGSFDIQDVAFESTSLDVVNTSPTSWHVQYDILDTAREEVIQFYATDIFGEQSNRATLRISIPAQKMIYVQGSALNGKVGEKLEHEIIVTGGVAPYILTVSPALPDGLALNDGKIEGTPTAEGGQLVQITAIDAEGTVGSGIFNITIAPADAATISLPNFTLNGKVGESFSQPFAATGGTEPYIYELVDASALPDGLALSGNVISGVPTVDGTFIFELKATDGNSATGTQSYTLTVVPADAVIEAPKAENGSLDLDFGQSGTVDLAQLVTGEVDKLVITAQPKKGVVKLDGNIVTFTPKEGETGSDQFSFTVSNAGGSSTGTITVTMKEPTGEPPVAKNHMIRLQPTQSGAVNLVDGAVSKEPILMAHILSSLPANTGSADLADTRLGFQPHKAFAGSAVVSYQLENKWGRSAIATATFIVAERPDPSKDPEVKALLNAQKEAAINANYDQVDNITRRLEQIRGEAPGNRENSFDWQFGVDSKDNARYDHEGNEIGGKNSASARGSFKSSNPLAAWTTGYIRFGETDLGGLDLKATAVGGTAGLDYRFSPQFVGGVATGFGRELAEIGSNGTENETKAISGAVYGTWHNQSGAFVDGILGFSHLTMDSSRYVTSTGQMANGTRDGTTIFGSVIGGYRFETENGLKIEPYAGFRGVVGKLNGFTERGDDWTNLAYGTTDIRSLKAVAGMRLEKQYETDDFLITPNAKVEYRRELADGTSTALGYADLGTMPYSVMTDPSETSSVVASLGVRVKPKASNLSVEVSAQASMSGSGKPTMTYAVRTNWEICGIGFKKTDCMTREQRVTFFKGELAKAEKKKDAKKIAEFKKLLAKAEADLREWNALSAKLTPVPDMNTQFVDTISGKGKRKR